MGLIVRIRYIVFIFFTCFTFCCSVFGQEVTVNFSFYNETDGLSHRDVECIQQDSIGRLWVGTKSGLNLFDGNKFKHFLHIDYPNIPREVNQLLVDEQNHFWMVYLNDSENQNVLDLAIFDPIDEEIVSQGQINETLVALVESGLSHLYQTKTNRIFCFSSDYLKIYLFESDSIVEYSSPRPGSRPTDIAEMANGQIAFVFKPKGKPFELVVTDTMFNELWEANFSVATEQVLLSQSWKSSPTIAIEFIGKRWRKKNWYKVEDQLLPMQKDRMQKYQAFNQFQKRELFSSARFFNALPNNKYLLYLDGKYYLYDDHKHQFANIEMNNDQEAFCSGFFIDRFENIWATSQFGFAYVDVRPSLFTRLVHNKQNRMTENVICRSFLFQEGDLFVATDRPGYLIHIPDLESVLQHPGAPTPYQLLDGIGPQAMSIVQDSLGNIFYYNSHTLYKYDPESRVQTKIVDWPISKRKRNAAIWAMHIDSYNRILAGNEDGQIGIYDPKNEYRVITLDSTGPAYVYQFLPRNEHLWVVTSSGIFVLDNKSLTVQKRFWKEGEGASLLLDDDIRHIYIDANETAWLATSGKGLLRWHLPTNDQKLFTKANHFPENDIYAVYEDSRQRLWIPSVNGIIMFDKLIHTSEVYGLKDGISHPEFNRLSHAQLNTGELVFGGLNGITIFHPDSILPSEKLRGFTVVLSTIEKFENDSSRIIQIPFNPGKEVTIPMSHDDPFVTILASALFYQDVDGIKYAYQLKGENDQWVITDDPSITLTWLSYGHHEIVVKAILSDGSWSENEAIVHVHVKRPYYAKSWFFGLLLLLFMGGVYALYSWRTTIVKNNELHLRKEVDRQTAELREVNTIISAQSEKLKELDMAKTNFFANISHELRTPLTLISGPIKSVLLKNNLSDRDRKLLVKAHDHSRSLLAQINEIMDMTKLENDQLEYKATPSTLYHSIKKLIGSFESYAEMKSIQMELLYTMDKQIIVMVDKKKFERILNNLITNAIKFTDERGSIRIKVDEKNGEVHIAVIDSGKGIHPSEVPYVFDRYYQAKQGRSPALHGTGIGLSMAQEYAKLFGGKITLKSILAQGSRFTFIFPLVEAINVPSDLISISEQHFPSVAKVKSLNWPLNAEVQNDSGKKAKILVVEDNFQLQSFLKFILSEMYRVSIASNGIKAIKKMRMETFDLILSDVMMPEMDGFEMLHEIKSDPELYRIPVIMLTAKTNLEDKLKALRIGVDDYLVKPFDEEELLVRVENSLKFSRQKKKALEQSDQSNPILENQQLDENSVHEIDLKWLKLLEETMITNMVRHNYNLDHLAMDLHVSRSQLNRRVKQLTGMTPSAYMLEVRLQMVRQMLENGKVSTVKEAIYSVGIKEPKHFSRQFKNRFGKSPSSYRDLSA